MKTVTEKKAPARSSWWSAFACVLYTCLLTAALVTAGCSGPTIDATTEDNLQASIERIHTRLSSEERAAFDSALNDLNYLLFHSTDAVTQATISQYRPEALLRKILHGKTAREIIIMVNTYGR